MGKRARERKAKRAGTDPLSAAANTDRGTTVTVCAAPHVDGTQWSAEPEVRALRSTLLYADHVNLVAPAVAMMDSLWRMTDLDPDRPWEGLAALPAPAMRRLGFENVPLRDVRRLFRSIDRLPEGHPRRVELQQEWSREAIGSVVDQAQTALHEHLADDLGPALESGAVTLISDGFDSQDSTDQQIAWFGNRLTQLLQDPGTVPMLPDETVQLVRSAAPGEELWGRVQAALEEEVLDSRARQTYTGAGLVERLPAFPNAPIADVLAVRAELEEGRARYRRAVAHLTETLRSSALDVTLPSEVDQLWNDEVRVALRDMRATVSASRLGHGTARGLVDQHVAASLVCAVTSVAGVADALPNEHAQLAYLGAGGRVLVALIQEAFRARESIRQHDLVYLYDVNRRLG